MALKDGPARGVFPRRHHLRHAVAELSDKTWHHALDGAARRLQSETLIRVILTEQEIAGEPVTLFEVEGGLPAA